MNPVGIFWDVQNCQIPRGVNVADIVNKIRNEFVHGIQGIEYKFVFCSDVRSLPINVSQTLNEMAISILHVETFKPNAADEILINEILRFVHHHHHYAHRCLIVLISGDGDFVPVIQQCRMQFNANVVVLHNECFSPELVNLANFCALNFNSYLKSIRKSNENDIVSPVKKKCNNKCCRIIVSGFSAKQSDVNIFQIILKLLDHCKPRELFIQKSIVHLIYTDQSVLQTAVETLKQFVIVCENNAVIPKRATTGSAGFDLYCLNDESINPREVRKISTGVRIAIPKGNFGLVLGRSGLALNNDILIHTGTIDSDYRGDIFVIIKNCGNETIRFRARTKIAQIVFIPIVCPELIAVDGYLDKTERNENGFGSTGLF